MDAGRPLHWFKSSYSGGSGTECVEVAAARHRVLIRDSKRITHARLDVGANAWVEFLASIRDIPSP